MGGKLGAEVQQKKEACIHFFFFAPTAKIVASVSEMVGGTVAGTIGSTVRGAE